MQISVLAITIGNRNLVLIAALLSVLKKDKKTARDFCDRCLAVSDLRKSKLWGAQAACRRHFHEAKHQLRCGLFGKLPKRYRLAACAPQKDAPNPRLRVQFQLNEGVTFTL